MSNRTTHVIVAALTLALLAAGLLLAPKLPATVVSHWNFQGVPDGTMPRDALLLTFPALIAGMYLLIVVLIRILLLRENVADFRPQLNLFLVALSIFLAYVAALSLAWNLSMRFSFSLFILPAMAALFYMIGDIMGRAKRNWLFGIRTPWTLSSDQVWDETHRFGGWVFKVCAVLTLGTVFLGDSGWPLLLIPLLVGSLGTVAYSSSPGVGRQGREGFT